MIILDTDPGIDDMMALLLLMTTPKAQHEFKMISLTFGNCSLPATLNNALSMFYVITKENEIREQIGLPKYSDQRPVIHLGSSRTIDGIPPKDATDVHGNDGLGGISQTHPEFNAPEEWKEYFETDAPEPPEDLPFIVGKTPSWQAMLDVLEKEPEGTVTIITVGPFTNVCRAAQENPKVFSRVKEVLSMAAAISVPGNVTPLSEFNVYADPLAAAQMMALTSRHPEFIMPRGAPDGFQLPKPLNLTVFPLDITDQHSLYEEDVKQIACAALETHPDSPMAKWCHIWLELGFEHIYKITGKRTASISLHDPLTAQFAVQKDLSGWKIETLDVRAEPEGQWSAGLTVTDRRGRARLENNPHDFQKWLTKGEGNNVKVLVDTPIKETFARSLLHQILGGVTKYR